MSEKRRIPGILLNSRRQLRIPYSIAASVLVLTLISLHPSPSYASTAPVLVSQGACSGESTMPAKNGLRKVVHRKPVPFMPHAHVPQYLLVYCVETLECGHTVKTYPQADPLIAVRRRCENCGGNVVAIDVGRKAGVSPVRKAA